MRAHFAKVPSAPRTRSDIGALPHRRVRPRWGRLPVRTVMTALATPVESAGVRSSWGRCAEWRRARQDEGEIRGGAIMTERKRPVISDGMPSQLPDTDPDETHEWVDSLDGVIEERGRQRARYIMLRLLERARERQVGVPPLTTTDYINTIPPEREPWFPGNEHVERRIRAYIRWN